MNFSSLLQKPLHYFLGPYAEPLISIKDTIISTLEKYTQASYPKVVVELVDGQFYTSGLPFPLIPVPPEINNGSDFVLIDNNNDKMNFYFIKLIKIQQGKQIKLGNSEKYYELNNDDWVLAIKGDSTKLQLVQYKDVCTPSEILFDDIDPKIANVRGLVISRVERLVDLP